MKANKSPLLVALATIALTPVMAHAAATIVIVNADSPGVGFNDTTPAAPVGGNAGTTVGQQRLIAFQAAANKWGATLTSIPFIRVQAQWTALACNATGAVLGSAGATQVYRDFPGATKTGTWYGAAQTSALFGATADPSTPEINANFNVNLGQPGCLTGTFFYLGLDNNHGNDIDLVTVLAHEFGHGLGFQTFTNGVTGAYLNSFPSIWDHYLFDSSTGKTWVQMTNSERAASALKTGKLVWTGGQVNAAAPGLLTAGVPSVKVTQPASIIGSYDATAAFFGPSLTTSGVSGEVMPVIDQPDGVTGQACTALSAVNAAAVAGKIALVDRSGSCLFTDKIKNVQNAGAIGVIVVRNDGNSPALAMSGTDPTITIPAVQITRADGVPLRTVLAKRSRAHSGLFASLVIDLNRRNGLDADGHVRMYAPNPFVSGSSVSHYDTALFINQLMEPNINGDLTHEVTPPNDMTYTLLKDIGWQ